MSGSSYVQMRFQVLPSRRQRSIVVTLEEWQHIKKKVGEIRDRANFFHTIGSVLLGGSASALITALTNEYSDPTKRVICWAIVFSALVCGILSLVFGSAQRRSQNVSSTNVIEQMNLIEGKFEQEDIEDRTTIVSQSPEALHT